MDPTAPLEKGCLFLFSIQRSAREGGRLGEATLPSLLNSTVASNDPREVIQLNLLSSILLPYLEDFCPDFESSDSSGFVGFAWAGSWGEVGLLPLPEPAAPPLLIITIVP